MYEIYKNVENVYYMDKMWYSVFVGMDLEMKLRERGIEEVYFVGVCIDICVFYIVVDVYNKGFKIVVYEKVVVFFNV